MYQTAVGELATEHPCGRTQSKRRLFFQKVEVRYSSTSPRVLVREVVEGLKFPMTDGNSKAWETPRALNPLGRRLNTAVSSVDLLSLVFSTRHLAFHLVVRRDPRRGALFRAFRVSENLDLAQLIAALIGSAPTAPRSATGAASWVPGSMSALSSIAVLQRMPATSLHFPTMAGMACCYLSQNTAGGHTSDEPEVGLRLLALVRAQGRPPLIRRCDAGAHHLSSLSSRTLAIGFL